MYYPISLILILISSLSFFGGVVYYFYALNFYGITASLALTALTFAGIFKYVKREFNNQETRPEIQTNFKLQISNFFYFLAVIPCFYFLISSRTVKSIISPWEVVPAYFFLFYALATLILFIMIIKEKANLFLLSIHAFLSFSIALIVYKIGYGFDPFIHEATLKLIDEKGFVEPKPFYYLGQYSLIIIAHKLFFIPIAWLNKFLVPLLASLLLPFYLFKTLEKFFGERKNTFFTILTLLILPFSIFIMTTPQNLGFLFLALVIIIGLAARNRLDFVLIFSLSLAALITQPIAGIPALMLSALLAIYKSGFKFKRSAYAIIFTISALALPASLYIINPNFNFRPLKEIFTLPSFSIPFQENFIYNFIYLYGFNLGIIFIALAIAGLVIFWKNKKYPRLSLYFLLSFSFFLSYFLTQNLSFDYLIGYERGAYAERILFVSALLLFPLSLLAIYNLGKKILNAENSIKIPFMAFLTILITTSLYVSYPRFDNYHNSKGYSTGENDIKAVGLIEEEANGDYIVLANQQVSAAALNEFGFNRYYENDIFFYPIPTSGPLYNYYLDMVYKKPSRETMLKAMDLAGVRTGYFVLNKYWWAFNKIVDEAKLEADSWQKLGKGEIYIFKYEKEGVR